MMLQQPSGSQLQMHHSHHQFSPNPVLSEPTECKFCQSGGPVLSLPNQISMCSRCHIVVHNKCIQLKEYSDHRCGGYSSKHQKKPSLTTMMKKMFTKSSKHLFKKHGEQMVQTGSLSKDNLRNWIKLITSEENGKHIYNKKYYDIFNKVKVDETTFKYILSLQYEKLIPDQEQKLQNTCTTEIHSKSMTKETQTKSNTNKKMAEMTISADIKYSHNSRNDVGQFLMISILYRLMFTSENIIYFAHEDTLNTLSNLYIYYLKTIKSTPLSPVLNHHNNNNNNTLSTNQQTIATLNTLSLKLFALLLKLFENEILLPLYFNTRIIEALVTLCLEKDNLSEKLQNEEINTSDDIISLLGTYFKKEPYRSIIEKHSDWLDLILKASTRNCNVHRELDPQQVIFGEMLYESPLCTVYQGRFEGNDVAIKQLSVEGLGFEWESFFKEVTIACVSQHPRVVKCLGAHTQNTAKPFIVTEYCSRGNLMQALESYVKENHSAPPLALIHNMAVEAAQSIDFLHSKSLIHRDIKSGNFLVKEDYSVKLIDFGTSKVFQNQLHMTCIGTPMYMAEEVIKGEKYTQSADIYSFAIVLWELFTRQTPFGDMTEFARVNYVLTGGRPTIPDTVPSIIADLIQRCWHTDPMQRPSTKKVLQTLYIMSHPAPLESVLTIVPMVDVNLRTEQCTLEKVFRLLDFKTLLKCTSVSRSWRRAVYLSISNPLTSQHYSETYWQPMIDKSITDLTDHIAHESSIIFQIPKY